MAAFKEGVQILHKMWTEDYPTFEGTYYTIDGPINEPKSHKPGYKIPLWIGGGGPQVTLKLVAQYGDACNVGDGEPDLIRQKLNVLRHHCEAVGRDYDSIVKSTEIPLFPLGRSADRDRAIAPQLSLLGVSAEEFTNRFWVGTSEEIVDRLQPAIEAGIDYVIFYIPGVAYDHSAFEQVAREVVPQVA
jgi:alkanesulfonate monooxygenase SsuD/methylene tetrahydromethanopterin reductase-like flavin-dependent oxidoreductase (luciferase family)